MKQKQNGKRNGKAMILLDGDKKLQQLVENLQLVFVIDVKYLLFLVLCGKFQENGRKLMSITEILIEKD